MSETPFPVFRKGEVREEILSYFRNGLRQMTNPDTGEGFTEDEIAIATSDLTNWWAEANAIDLVGLAFQSRALWLADQAWPDRASSDWLRNRHGTMWSLTPLPAAGGGGSITGECVAGATFVGSSEIPSDSADYFVDDAGRRYQVTQTKIAATSSVTLQVKGIDAGPGTNLLPGASLRPVRAPSGTGTFAVDERFRGGTPAETDAGFALRILRRIRHRQGAGNWAHLRDLGSSVDGGVEDVFVYPCAYYGNSFHACVVSRRAGVEGPTARIAPAGMVAMVGGILSPGGRDVPGQVHSVVTAAVAQLGTISIGIDLAVGRASGWKDPDPWPPSTAIVSATGTLEYTIEMVANGVDPSSAAPSIMIWDRERSRFEALKVLSWAPTATPGKIVATVGDAPAATIWDEETRASPLTLRAPDIAAAFGLYIDSLGPFELFAGARGGRGWRQPRSDEEWPSAFSLTEAASWIKEALGPAVGARGMSWINEANDDASVAVTYPVNPADGPRMITIAQFSIHPQE